MRNVHLHSIAEQGGFEPVGRVLLLRGHWGALQHPPQAAPDEQGHRPLQVHQPHPGLGRLRQGHARGVDQLGATCRYSVPG